MTSTTLLGDCMNVAMLLFLIAWQLLLGYLVIRRCREFTLTNQVPRLGISYLLRFLLGTFELSASFVVVFSVLAGIGGIWNSVSILGTDWNLLNATRSLIPHVKWTAIVAVSTSLTLCPFVAPSCLSTRRR